MNKLPHYTKVLNLGSAYTDNALIGNVVVQEKIDGCIGINERVLTKNLEYKKAKDLKIGEELWGITNNWHPNKSMIRCSKEFYNKNPHNGVVSPTMCLTKVTYAKQIWKECYKVITNKRKIIVSSDHPFLINRKKYYGISKYWRQVKDLKLGDKIVSVGTWKQENSYISGYIAGQFDGEGSLCRVNPKKGYTRHITYTQGDNKGIEIIENALIQRGFRFSKLSRKRNPKWKLVHNLQIRGGILEFLRFLGTFRPQRLLKKIEPFLNNCGMNGLTYETVVQLKSIGKQQVMGLSTENQTYIAEGLFSHNSQFRFGIDSENNLVIGSKGCILNPVRQEDGTLANVDNLFKPAVEHLLFIEEKIKTCKEYTNEIYFYAETLFRPKHNVLKYEKTPKNNIVLFDVMIDNNWMARKVLEDIAKALDIDVIPELYRGKADVDKIKELLTTKSYLGNETVEGVVIKNYTQTILLGGKVFPLFTKYVNEKFRERHGVEWKNKKPKDNLKNFIDSFKSEARWQKAIIHLKEKGELETSPRDIGKLILEVQKDIKEEEADTIKKGLYKLFIKDILRVSVRGIPEWYKQKLLENLKEE